MYATSTTPMNNSLLYRPGRQMDNKMAQSFLHYVISVCGVSCGEVKFEY